MRVGARDDDLRWLQPELRSDFALDVVESVRALLHGRERALNVDGGEDDAAAAVWGSDGHRSRVGRSGVSIRGPEWARDDATDVDRAVRIRERRADGDPSGAHRERTL